MEYLLLGNVVDSFGLDGSLKIYSTTDNAKLRYKKGASIFLYNKNSEERTEYKVLKYKESGKFDLVKLEGIDSPEHAKEFKGFEVHAIKDRNDLKVGYYFYSDLVGCSIIDQDHNVYGKVSVVEEFPAQITLRVKREKQPDFFVPFIKQFILNVDLENKEITVNIMKGML